MHPEPTDWFDIVIPIGAILVIAFSLSSIYWDGRTQITSTRVPPDAFKIYRGPPHAPY